LLTIVLKIGAAVDPPVTYSDSGLTEAPHKITDPTTGPSNVSINPVKEVLNLKSE
jgi:hypothetical protein